MTNGTLQYKNITGGGIDGNGDPIPVIWSWSEVIDCLIIPNGNGQLTKYQDGEQVKALYTIHLESDTDFNHETIRITNSRGKQLGEYQILAPNVQYLDVVGLIKIIL